MTEKELQAAVVQLAKLLGWKVYHTYDSRRSEPGFPDLMMLRGECALAVELKSAKGKVTPAQLAWLNAFYDTGVGVRVWRPADWMSGLIERVLRDPDMIYLRQSCYPGP